jgi:hypothetical protein
MKHVLLIVGTDHNFQTGGSEFTLEQHSAFIEFIKDKVVLHNAVAICEEENLQALAAKSLTQSVLEPLALQLGLSHGYCDPNLDQRAAIGIWQENAIRIQAWQQGRHIGDDEVARKLNESNELRENYWIQKLLELDTWPVLFVCGATHVASFVNLAAQAGLYPKVLANDWGS